MPYLEPLVEEKKLHEWKNNNTYIQVLDARTFLIFFLPSSKILGFVPFLLPYLYLWGFLLLRWITEYLERDLFVIFPRKMEAENVRNITRRPILTRFPLSLYGFKGFHLFTWCLHSLMTGDQAKAQFWTLELLFSGLTFLSMAVSPATS